VRRRRNEALQGQRPGPFGKMVSMPQDEVTSEPPVPPAPAAPEPVLPTQSSEDTDIGWGDYREPDDDERLRGDRPPHWER
jgi:hypothetical protein